MARYLDPKNDMLFKKIFGGHKDLLISFLNALLPLGGREIKEIEYLSPEEVPQTQYGKFSIVDVKCKDNTGQVCIVEMQMEWTNIFRKRLLVNGSKAVVKQMDKTNIEDEVKLFSELQPVYVLAVVNDEFTDKNLKNWYHHLQIVDAKNPELVLTGLDYILLELPKFKPETWTLAEKQMAVLWLRFLREVEACTKNLSEELLSNKYIKSAIDMCEESAMTPKEKEAYDQWQDQIIWQKTIKKMEETVEENRKTIAEDKKTITEDKKTIAEKEKELAIEREKSDKMKEELSEKDELIAKLLAVRENK